MSNNEHCHSDFEFAGPHTASHHLFFQIFELMKMHCERTMNGLSPCSLTHEPETRNNKLRSEAKEEREVQVEEWTTPNEHVRVENCVKTHDDNEEGSNENRCKELHDDDSENEEEDSHHCDVINNNDEVKTLKEPEEFVEKEHEQEHFDLLIDEHMCNTFHNVCLCNLINEDLFFYRKTEEKTKIL